MPRVPRLDRATACVLVVDLQERLAPAMWHEVPVEKYCRALVLGGQELGLPVLATEQYPRGLGETLPAVRELLPSPPLVKMHFSCLGDPAIAAAVEATGRRQVLLAGLETHVCVLLTARDLLERGQEVFVCADAVTSRTEEHRRIGLEAMRDMGAHVTSAESALFELLGVCGTAEFKRISALVK